jgi:hypothetical protein
VWYSSGGDGGSSRSAFLQLANREQREAEQGCQEQKLLHDHKVTDRC